jgi:hypothetical protein
MQALTNSNLLGMSFEEATELLLGPGADELRARYPTLTEYDEQIEAWIDDNRKSVEDALTVYIPNDRNFDNLYVFSILLSPLTHFILNWQPCKP